VDRRALTLAGVASLALHAALLAWWWPTGATRIATPQRVFVEAFLVPPQSPPATADPAVATIPLVTPPAPPPPSVGNPAPKPQSPYIALDAAPVSDEPKGYLPFDAVDQAATPLGDWAIDTEALPRGKPLRVVLKLWISSTGVIDRWELEAPEADHELARRAMADLERTALQPAFLNRVAVPSYRQLEIVLSRD
jgi:hypothetical protein